MQELVELRGIDTAHGLLAGDQALLDHFDGNAQGGGAFAYQAVRKQRTDLPTLNCAAAKVGEEYRVVVGSRPARAMLLRDERGILAGGVTEESAAAFADYAAGAVPVSGNMWGSAEYRRALVPVLVRRTLLALGEVR